jgi:hypothetical protein
VAVDLAPQPRDADAEGEIWGLRVGLGLGGKKAKKVIKDYRSAAYGIEGLKTIFTLCLLIYSKMMMIENYVCVE